jgi:hypothetical protein
MAESKRANHPDGAQLQSLTPIGNLFEFLPVFNNPIGNLFEFQIYNLETKKGVNYKAIFTIFFIYSV